MSRIKVPKKPDERREWIKYQLRVVGSSLSGISAELKVSRQAVSSALTMPYPKMEKAIARKLGVPPEKLWPERYAA